MLLLGMVSIAPEFALFAPCFPASLGRSNAGSLAHHANVAGEPFVPTGRIQPAGQVGTPQVHTQNRNTFQETA
jgi:hypothetical protein